MTGQKLELKYVTTQSVSLKDMKTDEIRAIIWQNVETAHVVKK